MAVSQFELFGAPVLPMQKKPCHPKMIQRGKKIFAQYNVLKWMAIKHLLISTASVENKVMQSCSNLFGQRQHYWFASSRFANQQFCLSDCYLYQTASLSTIILIKLHCFLILKLIDTFFIWNATCTFARLAICCQVCLSSPLSTYF